MRGPEKGCQLCSNAEPNTTLVTELDSEVLGFFFCRVCGHRSIPGHHQDYEHNHNHHDHNHHYNYDNDFAETFRVAL